MDKLSLINISHHFDNQPIFDGLNLSVKQGQVVAIVGTSGVGKTTLFNIASGLLTPATGRVCVDGAEITGQAGFVGYMLQKDLLLPFKSVYDNISLPLTLKGESKEMIKAKITPLLADFGLDSLVHKYPSLLSGGQRQRAALLRTYLSNQQLMLLDEPFSALDFATKHAMYDWFAAFQQKHALTCLMITHDIDEAMALAETIFVLKGSPAMLAYRFDIPKDKSFFASNDYLHLKQAILTAIRS